MINSDFPKINCPKCGHNDWYFLGRHRTCRPCNASAQRRYAARQALGQGRERRTRAARPLSESLAVLPPVPAQRRRERQTCQAGHSLSGVNLAWLTDRQGRQARRCRTCHRSRQRERYGMSRPDSLSALLEETTAEQGS